MAPTRIARHAVGGIPTDAHHRLGLGRVGAQDVGSLDLDVGRAEPGADRAGPVIGGAVHPIEVDLLAVLVEQRQLDVR